MKTASEKRVVADESWLEKPVAHGELSDSDLGLEMPRTEGVNPLLKKRVCGLYDPEVGKMAAEGAEFGERKKGVKVEPYVRFRDLNEQGRDEFHEECAPAVTAAEAGVKVSF